MNSRSDSNLSQELNEFFANIDEFELQKWKNSVLSKFPSSQQESSSLSPAPIRDCLICKSNLHQAWGCPISSLERRSIITNQGRCLKCFGSDHIDPKECWAGNCAKCKQKHHFLYVVLQLQMKRQKTNPLIQSNRKIKILNVDINSFELRLFRNNHRNCIFLLNRIKNVQK